MPRKTSLLLLPGLLVAASLAPYPATAQNPTVRGQLERGPVLAGDGAAWVENRAKRPRVRVGGGGSASGTVFAAKRGQSLVAFAGSPSHLVFDFQDVEDGGRGPELITPHLRAGPPAGPFAQVPSNCGSGIFDLEGSLFASFEGGCANDLGQSEDQGIISRDLEAGTKTVIEDSFIWSESDLGVAGPYIAYADLSETGTPAEPGGITVAVVDRSTGALIFRTQQFPAVRSLAFDLRADGTLAVARSTGKKTNLSWYSIAEPREHRISTALRSTGVRLVGDRVLYERRLSGGRGALTITRLGAGSATVARFAARKRSGIVRVGTFAYDGTRVTWAQRKVRVFKVRVRGKNVVQRVRRGPVKIVVRRAPAP